MLLAFSSFKVPLTNLWGYDLYIISLMSPRSRSEQRRPGGPKLRVSIKNTREKNRWKRLIHTQEKTQIEDRSSTFRQTHSKAFFKLVYKNQVREKFQFLGWCHSGVQADISVTSVFKLDTVFLHCWVIPNKLAWNSPPGTYSYRPLFCNAELVQH